MPLSPLLWGFWFTVKEGFGSDVFQRRFEELGPIEEGIERFDVRPYSLEKRRIRRMVLGWSSEEFLSARSIEFSRPLGVCWRNSGRHCVVRL